MSPIDDEKNGEIPGPFSLRVYAMERVFRYMTSMEQQEVLSRIDPSYDYIAIDIPEIKDLYKKMLLQVDVREFLDNERFVAFFVDGKLGPIHADIQEKRGLATFLDIYIHNCLIVRDTGLYGVNVLLKSLRDKGYLKSNIGTWFQQEDDIITIRKVKKSITVLYYDSNPLSKGSED